MPIVNKLRIHLWVGYQEYLNSYIIWLCKDVQISEVSHFHIRTAPCWVKLAGLCPQEADRQRQTSNHQKNMRRSKKANVQTLDWSSLLLVAARRLYLRRCEFVFSFWYFLNDMDLWTSETILVSTLSKPQVHNINVYNQATNPKQTKCWGVFSLYDAGPTTSTFWDVEPTYECDFKKFIVWRSTF